MSRGDLTVHQFSSLQLDPGSPQKASLQFFLSGTRRKTAQHLRGTLPMYLSDMSLCYREFRLQTSRAMFERPGGAPVWGIILPGLCSFLCSSLCDHFLDWGQVGRALAGQEFAFVGRNIPQNSTIYSLKSDEIMLPVCF